MDLPKKDSDIYFNIQIFCMRCPTFCERRSTVFSYLFASIFYVTQSELVFMCQAECTQVPQPVQLRANQFHAFDGRDYGFSIWQCGTSPSILLYSHSSLVACSS